MSNEMTQAAAGSQFVNIGERTNVTGSARFRDLIKDDDFDTDAGYILERLGRVPESGESLEADGLRFEVLEATPTRIDRVAVERLGAVEGGVDAAAGEVG